jgi:hypothetical protein
LRQVQKAKSVALRGGEGRESGRVVIEIVTNASPVEVQT